MGEEISSFDWLPAGWTVESRVRRNGKRDKCYTDPSNKHKFYSKIEVLRYLKSVRIKCEGESTRKSSRNGLGMKIVVKEAVAEGLPAGWIKEIRVTKKGNKIRRDPYYIDPATGHLFRSMKEVSRYLDTGKKPTRAPKPKDQEPTESPTETGKERSACYKAKKLDAENPNHKAASEAPPTDHVNKSKINNLEQIENNESRSPIGEGLQEKLQPDKGVEGNGTECNKKKKMNKKRGAELPRRTSKRLAGIAIELPLELKACNRAHQAAATQMGEGEANCVDNFRESEKSDEHVKLNRVRTGNDGDEKQEDLGVSSAGDAVSQEEDVKEGTVWCKGDNEQQETPVDLPLKDLWKDPCIEFAIKTLTGAIPILEDHKVAKDPMFSVGLAGAVPENQDLPPGNIWADPCIEFAVKTLTGDLPTGNNRDMQNVFQQQPHYTTNLVGEKGLLLPSFWSNEASPAGISFTHSDDITTKRTYHKQL